MSVHSILSLCLAALVLAGAASAEEKSATSPTPAAVPVSADGESPTSDRGLRPRIQLARDEERVYGPCPSAGSEPVPVEAVGSDDELDLSKHLALNLNPTQLRSPNEPGRRQGHGGVVLSVPLNDAMDLRTGVRVDYDSGPSSQSLAAEATPTIGVGFEF